MKGARALRPRCRSRYSRSERVDLAWTHDVHITRTSTEHGGRRVVEIVIGDVHARPDALRALLRTVGALDVRGRRTRGCWIVQLGDLLDRRASPSANLATARLATRFVDVVLAGNHEALMLRERSRSYGAALATLAARGWPHAAAECGGWLVTHAGVHPGIARELPGRAAESAAEINDRWHRRSPRESGDPLFDWVGPARGGRAPYGGIFWSHPVEWGRAHKTAWGQITGHVPHPEPRLLAGRRWVIDVGARYGRLAALIRNDGDCDWHPVVVDAADRRGMRARAVA